MKEGTPKQKKRFHAVKAEMKVTGVRFGGYRTQYDGKETQKEPVKQEKDSAGKENDTKQTEAQAKAQKEFYIRNAKVSKKAAEAGHGTDSQKMPQRKGGSGGTESDSTDGRQMLQRKPESVRMENNSTDGGQIPEGKPVPAQTEKWKHGPSSEEIIRKCGIRENRYGMSAVRTREQKMTNLLSEEAWDMVPEPQVCSVEEREKIRQRMAEKHTGARTQQTAGRHTEKTAGDRAGKSRPAGDGSGKKAADKAKKKMLRNYIMKELIREMGQADPENCRRRSAQIGRLAVGGALSFAGKLLWKAVKLILEGLFLVLLLIAAVLLLLVFVVIFLLDSASCFRGIYETDDRVGEHPQYVKNVVEEMYADFYRQIHDFSDRDSKNELWYAYGEYSEAEEVIAVYLAQLCNTEGYMGLSEKDDAPPYLLVDTSQERELLEEVFREFNYYDKATIRVKEDDGKKERNAERMTVYCLSIDKWKECYFPSLSEEEKRLLEMLLEQTDDTPDTGGDGASCEENAVPITELVIPEGVDEKLVYLAGFLKAEAGNQPERGKIAVGYVILNRAGGAEGNIKGVLTAPYQFSCYIPYHTVEKYLQEYTQMTEAQREADACWRAALAVCEGSADNPIGDRKYYCNPKGCSVGEEEQWRKIRAKNAEDEIIVIGDHVFCKNCW